MAKKKEKLKYYWEKDDDTDNFFDNTNIDETDREIIVKADLSGFKKEEINLNVTENTLEISAFKKEKKIERTETAFRQEMGSSSVKRLFTLPYRVDTERVNVKVEDGLLTVIMPKKEKKKTAKNRFKRSGIKI